MHDPRLLVEIGPHRYYPWRIAAPMLLSALCFERSLPTEAIEKLGDAQALPLPASPIHGTLDSAIL